MLLQPKQPHVYDDLGLPFVQWLQSGFAPVASQFLKTKTVLSCGQQHASELVMLAQQPQSVTGSGGGDAGPGARNTLRASYGKHAFCPLRACPGTHTTTVHDAETAS